MAELRINGTSQQVEDSNGNELLKFGETASAVNEVKLTNAATGSGPVLETTGGDSNVPLIVTIKGAATLRVAKGISHVDAYTDPTLADAHPKWFKFTKTFTDLSTGATSNDIELFSLPAGGVIHAVKTKHSAAFTGGAISAYTLSVGIVGTLAKYATAFNVFQAPGNTVFLIIGTIGSENHGAATSIRLAAVATGANLNAATAGSVDVWVQISKAV